jgi:hypothetical protein
MILMKDIFLVFFLLKAFFVAFAQPANNDCMTATSLGSLPAPGVCNSFIQDGVPIVLSGQSNIGATAENPYISILNCNNGTVDMAISAKDVWYSFVATGTTINIKVSPDGSPILTTPNIGLWTGSCSNLQPRGCAVGDASGNLTASFPQIIIGQTYYIQISGNDNTSTGNFQLSVDNDIDCNNCLRTITGTASPQTVNGVYQPGQVVTFCFNISAWSIQNTNWFHGMQVAWGSAWANAAGTPTSYTPATSMSGSGTWDWYLGGCTSSAPSGTHYGAGFYYDYTTTPGNPGNNFGDYNSGGASTPYLANWTFCITLTAKTDCISNSDLSVTINTTSDGESGSWGSSGCIGDPGLIMPARINNSGGILGINVTTTNVSDCISNDGSILLGAVTGGGAPYIYSVNNNTFSSVTNYSGLAAGSYSIIVQDSAGCTFSTTTTVGHVASPTGVQTTSGTSSACGLANGTINILAVTGGTAPYAYSLNGTAFSSATFYSGLVTGVYTLVVKDSNSCEFSNTINVSGQIATPNITPEICIVTPDTNSNYNIVCWDKTQYVNVDSFIVYRKDALSSNYLQIGSVSGDSLSQFIDTSFSVGGPNGGNPRYSSWLYKLAILDSCGTISSMSPFHQTLFVQQNGSNFSWNFYAIEAGQTNPVTGYSLLRDDNGSGSWHTIVNTTALSATDPQSVNYPNARWRVEAIGFNCSSTRAITQYPSAYSNIVINGIVSFIGTQNIEDNEFNIYPNPNDGKFIISFSSMIKDNTILEIRNTLGQLIYKETLINHSSNYKKSYSLSEFERGVYFISLINTKKTEIKKIVTY